MQHCYGGGFPDPIFGQVVQGQCGSAELHDEHNFAASEKVCCGSAFSFLEADCGEVGPHEEHPLNTKPVMSDDPS